MCEAAPGSKSVGTPAIRNLNTPGVRAFRPAKVRLAHTHHEAFDLYCNLDSNDDDYDCMLTDMKPITGAPTSIGSRAIIRACTMCGTIEKSGKRSCCVRGGDWFRKCGNPGDPKFKHTWSEGIQACESTFALVRFEMLTDGTLYS